MKEEARTQEEESTTQKLMKSFMNLRKAEWLRPSVAGYKPSDIMVLFCIKRRVKQGEVGMKVSEIGSFLRVTVPTITQLIKGLEASDLVERHTDPTDRRVVRIGLTAKGEDVVKKAGDAFSASFSGLVEYLGEEQSIQLANLLDQVSRYTQAKMVSPSQLQSSGDDEI